MHRLARLLWAKQNNINGWRSSLHTNSNSYQYHVTNVGEHKQCPKCNRLMGMEHFTSSFRKRSSIFKHCEDCRRKQHQQKFEIYCTLNGFCTKICADSRHRRSMKARGRILSGSNELTPGSIKNQYEMQQGLGYLSKMQMNHRPLTDWQMSLDRRNDDEDYTIRNTVLEVLEFNHVTKWTEAKMQQIRCYYSPVCHIKI